MWTFSPVIPLLHSKEVKKGTHEWLHGHLGHGHRQSTDLLRGSTEGCRKDGNPQVISAGSCKKPHAAVVRDEAVQQIIEEEHPGAHQTTLGCRRCRAAVRCWEHGVLCAAAAVCIFWSSHESISDCKKKKKMIFTLFMEFSGIKKAVWTFSLYLILHGALNSGFTFGHSSHSSVFKIYNRGSNRPCLRLKYRPVITFSHAEDISFFVFIFLLIHLLLHIIVFVIFLGWNWKKISWSKNKFSMSKKVVWLYDTNRG